MIQIQNVTLMRGVKTLLQDTSLEIYTGKKVGIVGRNGCGKSSLFGLLRQEIQSESGAVNIPKEWRIISVLQETPDLETPALDYVIQGDAELCHVRDELEKAESLGDGEAIGALHEQWQQLGGYDVEARAATIMAGLGFNQDDLEKPVASFSGGWRMRMNLARTLLCTSDLLLLDEPTNHLDLDAVYWLEKWLNAYPGTLLLISHDREFLDKTVNQIASFESQKLVGYTGNYSSYEVQKAQKATLLAAQKQKQQQKIAHLESFINRFKAKASKAKQAQSRIKQLDKMEKIAELQHEEVFNFHFKESDKLPNPLVNMEQVKVGYGTKVILQEVKLNLVPGSRIGLLGHNGAGKSTLVKLLAEEIEALDGLYETSAGLKIGYFSQHQTELLRPNDSPLQHLTRIAPDQKEQQLRDYLGGFGFRGDDALSVVAPMSGGEKARLVLALIVYQRPNLLLLDEPTNHLDLDMRQALTFALQEYQGALILVSHDRFLLSAVCDQFYLVHNQKVDSFAGDLDDYKEWLFQNNSNEINDKQDKKPNSKKEQKRLEAEFRAATKNLRETIKKSEKRQVELQEELDFIEKLLSDAAIYDESQKSKLRELLAKQIEVKQALVEVETSWFEATEQLEEAQEAFTNEMVGG